jgi:hypothetical protein
MDAPDDLLVGDLMVTALGQHAETALDSEIILLGYLSPLSHQQIVLKQHRGAGAWQLTPAAVGGIEFQDCLLSRHGTLTLPRLQGGLLAVVSHAWSGMLELTTAGGSKRLDLFSEKPRAMLIDTTDGKMWDFDAQEVLHLRETFINAMNDESLVDQRDSGSPRQFPSGSAVLTGAPHQAAVQDRHLGMVAIRPLGTGSDASCDELVCIVEVEPIAGFFAELSRLSGVGDWKLERVDATVSNGRLAMSGRNGELRLQAAASGSISLLAWAHGGLAEIEIFGHKRLIDLYSAETQLRRIQFDEVPRHAHVSLAETESERRLQSRRDFYTAAVRCLDPNTPTALYVPRWKGVAASTRNLFTQTLPFPENVDDHPADISAEDIKFLSNLLLASGCRHFVISGGDLFWIDVIRRVQWDNPSIRFDLLWHSNYLQMGESHDWNLFKNWLRAISDGLVTKVAVVKSGLEKLLGRLGVNAIFIPNIIRSDPSTILYSGDSDLVGIWLSGSSSYRKVPFASLLALKSLDNVRLIGAGFDDESLAMTTEMKIPRGEIWRQPLPQEALIRHIRRTSLTLYVTLSECSPMLPLESMHAGVPCLVGANSHLFRSNPYLYRMLVVESPLSPQAIARQARNALAEGPAIIDAFGEYSRCEHQQAAEALSRFLS